PTYWACRERLTNPAYTSKPWFTEEFLTVSFRQPGRWFTEPDAALVFPQDCANRYFHVARGVRRTVGYPWAPGDPIPHKLFLLGGSTTYCSEVPDNLTWA